MQHSMSMDSYKGEYYYKYCELMALNAINLVYYLSKWETLRQISPSNGSKN